VEVTGEDSGHSGDIKAYLSGAVNSHVDVNLLQEDLLVQISIVALPAFDRERYVMWRVVTKEFFSIGPPCFKDVRESGAGVLLDSAVSAGPGNALQAACEGMRADLNGVTLSIWREV
jgi:hypothetical protein